MLCGLHPFELPTLCCKNNPNPPAFTHLSIVKLLHDLRILLLDIANNHKVHLFVRIVKQLPNSPHDRGSALMFRHLAILDVPENSQRGQVPHRLPSPLPLRLPDYLPVAERAVRRAALAARRVVGAFDEPGGGREYEPGRAGGAALGHKGGLIWCRV